jgi:hypothetical protein
MRRGSVIYDIILLYSKILYPRPLPSLRPRPWPTPPLMTATAGKGGLLMSTSASKNINACKKYTFLKQQYQLRWAEYPSSLLSLYTIPQKCIE